MTNGDLPLEDLAERGFAIYDRLRPALEPRLDGNFIAIHVDSGEYAVSTSKANAMRAVRKLKDTGQLFLRKMARNRSSA